MFESTHWTSALPQPDRSSAVTGESSETVRNWENFLAALPATLTLDRELNLCGFTTALGQLLGLAEAAPDASFTEPHSINGFDSLLDEARRVRDSNLPAERQYCGNDGTEYVRRITPLAAPRAGVVVTFTRLAEPRRAADGLKLKVSQERFRTIFERAAAGIALVAPDGSFLTVNDAMCRTHDYTREELLTRKYHEIIHPDDVEAERKLTGRILASEIETFAMEKRNLTKSGNSQWFHLTAAGVRGESGTTQYIIYIVEDISRRKQAEEAMVQLTRNLEKRVQQKTRSVRALQDIAVIANEAETIGEAFERTLARVCEELDWPIGHVFLSSETEPDRFVDSGIWYLQDRKRFASLVEATRETAFRIEDSSIGIVAASRQHYVAIDLANEAVFHRKELFEACGMHTGFAFPVLIRDEVVGILEFFVGKGCEFEMELVEGLSELGTQLGRVVERTRLDKQVADATVKEQQLLGQELHDTVAQELTGLGMLGERLRIDLEQDRSEREPLAASRF